MELKQEQGCRKMNGKNCSFEFKIFVIEQINNGQIFANFAAAGLLGSVVEAATAAICRNVVRI